MSILSIPNHILVPILSEWIIDVDLCNLDSAVCNNGQRDEFLGNMKLIIQNKMEAVYANILIKKELQSIENSVSTNDFMYHDERRLEWWLPFSNDANECLAFIEPMKYTDNCNIDIENNERRICDALNDVDLKAKTVVYHPLRKAPIYHLKCDWKSYKRVVERIESIRSELEVAVALDCEVRSSPCLNMEMESLTDDVWNNINWSSVEHSHSLSV